MTVRRHDAAGFTGCGAPKLSISQEGLEVGEPSAASGYGQTSAPWAPPRHRTIAALPSFRIALCHLHDIARRHSFARTKARSGLNRGLFIRTHHDFSPPGQFLCLTYRPPEWRCQAHGRGAVCYGPTAIDKSTTGRLRSMLPYIARCQPKL